MGLKKWDSDNFGRELWGDFFWGGVAWNPGETTICERNPLRNLGAIFLKFTRPRKITQIRSEPQDQKIDANSDRVNPYYHYGRERYMINSETFSTWSQHVKFTLINSSEFHACISYMGRYPLTCWGMVRMSWSWKRILNSFQCVD